MSMFAAPEQKKKPLSPFANEVFKEKLMEEKPAFKADEQIIKEIGVISQILKDGEQIEKKARADYEKGVKLEFERLKKTGGKKKEKKSERKLVKKQSAWDKKFKEGGKEQ
ncbi:hypothetical protein HY992_06480 [Candidatus Micrarchaeota archaeon]|nr:hypothetical protein [Candidatus Micrarchaeota archaeon]